MNIPFVVSKAGGGKWLKCDQLLAREIDQQVSRTIVSLYPNHADCSDNSQLIIEVVKK